jgi:hypothetical protein
MPLLKRACKFLEPSKIASITRMTMAKKWLTPLQLFDPQPRFLDAGLRAIDCATVANRR